MTKTAALHIDEHAGRFGHGSVADVLHHQREAWAGGDGESFGASPNRTLDGDRCCELVFHLDESPADGGYAGGETFDDFRGRGDGISGGEACSGGQCAFTAGMIAVQKMGTG